VSSVSFVQVESSNVKKAIEDSLDLIDYRFQKDIRKVAIKPNMCYYWDFSTGQTTDPKFVATLIEILRERISPDVDMSIVESDASAMKCKYAFKFLGYEKMAKNHDLRLVNLSEDESEKAEVTVGNEKFSFMMPHTIKNADLLISLPKIKYMVQTKISCALKNTFGCNPYPNKFEYHQKLDEAIVGLNKLIKFGLFILDGIIVSGIRPRRLCLVMASQDPVALDAAAARLAGVNPKSVQHVTLASKEGLGNISFIPKGISPKFFEKNYPRKGYTNKIMSSGYKLLTRTGLLNAEMM
jgi:uncharacterized protein (DUF362 family)